VLRTVDRDAEDAATQRVGDAAAAAAGVILSYSWNRGVACLDKRLIVCWRRRGDGCGGAFVGVITSGESAAWRRLIPMAVKAQLWWSASWIGRRTGRESRSNGVAPFV
jgi:hypothetical protein